MPGADLDLPIDRPDDRGLRSPLHINCSPTIGYNSLQPIMAAPLRPGETLASIDFEMASWVRSVVNLSQRPYLAGQVGFWLCPLSTLHQWFVDLYTSTAQDKMERAVDTQSIGTGARVADDPTTGHGVYTLGLQRTTRRWAGELGGNSGGTGLAGTEFAPYVSWATYKAAVDWYDLSMPNSFLFENVNLHDNPPGIGPYIRGALQKGFDAGTDAVDADPSTSTSFASLLETLFLLSQPEMTYAEKLAANGGNPFRAGGISQPVGLVDFTFSPQGNPQIVSHQTENSVITVGGSTDIGDTVQSHQVVTSGPVNLSWVHDRAAYGMLGATARRTMRRNLKIDEPSILLGTVCYWGVTGQADRYGTHFDVTRMTHPGHWGDRSFGGIDEEDFLAVQDIYDAAGVAPQAGGAPDQSGDNHVFNLLNLYLHGEETAIGPELTGNGEFALLREIGGSSTDGINASINGHFATRLNVLSDLVAGGQ